MRSPTKNALPCRPDVGWRSRLGVAVYAGDTLKSLATAVLICRHSGGHYPEIRTRKTGGDSRLERKERDESRVRVEKPICVSKLRR